MNLKHYSHISQLIGDIDRDGGYYIDDNLANILRSMPKVIVNSPDKIPVGKNYVELQSVVDICGRPFNFLLDGNRLLLRERVGEKGGFATTTYIMPIGEAMILSEFSIIANTKIDENTGEWHTYDGEKIGDYVHDGDKLKTKRARRDALHRKILIQHERLSRRAVKSVMKDLNDESLLSEFDKIKDESQILTRKGFPEWNIFQAGILKFLMEKQGTVHEDLITLDKKLDDYAARVYRKEHKLKAKIQFGGVRKVFSRLYFNGETAGRRERFVELQKKFESVLVPVLKSDEIEVEEKLWEKMGGQVGKGVIADKPAAERKKKVRSGRVAQMQNQNDVERVINHRETETESPEKHL